MRILSVFTLLAFAAICAAAQPTEIPAKTGTTQIPEPHTWSCTDPKDCNCVASTEDEKADCTCCKKWAECFGVACAALGLDRQSYRDDSGVARINLFFWSVSPEVYGVDFPETPDGDPILTRDFYHNYERYGWTRIEAGRSKKGSLAVWPTFGGLVIDDSPDPTILYPSEKKGGELTFGKAGKVKPRGTPIFLVPGVPPS